MLLRRTNLFSILRSLEISLSSLILGVTMKIYLIVLLVQALIVNLNAIEFESDELLANSKRSSLLERLIENTLPSNEDVEESESSGDSNSNLVKRAVAFKPRLVDADIALGEQLNNEETINFKKSLERFISRQNIGYNKRMGRVYDTDLCKNVICTNVPSNGQIAKTWKLVQQATCCYRKPFRG